MTVSRRLLQTEAAILLVTALLYVCTNTNFNVAGNPPPPKKPKSGSANVPVVGQRPSASVSGRQTLNILQGGSATGQTSSLNSLHRSTQLVQSSNSLNPSNIQVQSANTLSRSNPLNSQSQLPQSSNPLSSAISQRQSTLSNNPSNPSNGQGQILQFSNPSTSGSSQGQSMLSTSPTNPSNSRGRSNVLPNPVAANTESRSSTSRTPRACKILINEIYTGERSQNEDQYLELRRSCPKGVPKPTLLSLSGTFVFVVKLTQNPTLILAANLKDVSLKRKELRKTTGAEEIFMFGLGTSTNKEFDLRFGPKVGTKPKLQYKGLPQTKNVFPSETEDLVLVAVVYVPFEKRTEFWNKFSFPKGSGQNAHVFQELPLSTALRREFVYEFHDYIVYGSLPNNHAQNLVRELTRDENFDLAKSLLTIRPSTLIKNTALSYARCDDSPKSSEGFLFEPPTPMEPNICQDESQNRKLFTFNGAWFSIQAQKLIVNLVYSIINAKDSIKDFIGNPPEVAARLLGLHIKTVEKYLSRAASCNILNPSNSQRRMPVVDSIDSFDKKYIQNLIAKSYKKGIPPFANQIYKDFMSYKNGDSNSNQAGDETLVSTSEIMDGCIPNDDEDEMDPPELPATATTSATTTNDESKKFKCSYETFRKVLRQMGFYYGKIDNRVAIMNRWDLALWRTRFIRTLRENENSPNPMPVTYLDETWVDPFAKWDRGWRLRNPANTQEALRYSFGKTKIGSGPKLIVFVAADNNGIIKESIKVRKITKDAVKEDYHGNVDTKEFMDWFTKLLDYFDSKNEKHIIVLDNASYHSTMSAPTSKANKPELISWLLELKKDSRFASRVPKLEGLLKWELWDLVQRLKKDPEIETTLYKVDKLASDRGHKVLRNAPYHCKLNPVELIWSQVKSRVKKENTQLTVDSTKALVEEALNTYSTTIWENQLKHVKRLRDDAWEEDKNLDNTIASLVIPLDPDDEEDDDSESEDEETNNDLDAQCVSDDNWDDQKFADFQAEHQRQNELARQWVLAQGPTPKYNQRRPLNCRVINDGFYL